MATDVIESNQLVEIKQIKILGTPVACVTYQSAFEIIQTLAREPRPTAVCPANTHILSEARHDPNFARIMAKFDLVLNMWEQEHGLTGSLEYNTDLFEAETIIRMVRHFEVLLESIVARPRRTYFWLGIDSLAMLVIYAAGIILLTEVVK